MTKSAEEALARTDEPNFVQSLQGFAAMCESYAQDGIPADDCGMIAAKFRDAAFVVDQLQKLRDKNGPYALIPTPRNPAFEGVLHRVSLAIDEALRRRDYYVSPLGADTTARAVLLAIMGEGTG